MESTIHDELLVNNGIYPEEWLVENGRDPEMGIGQALGWADTIRRQWELCEELRDCRLPVVCVWDMNGERYRRAKKLERHLSSGRAFSKFRKNIEGNVLR